VKLKVCIAGLGKKPARVGSLVHTIRNFMSILCSIKYLDLLVRRKRSTNFFFKNLKFFGKHPARNWIAMGTSSRAAILSFLFLSIVLVTMMPYLTARIPVKKAAQPSSYLTSDTANQRPLILCHRGSRYVSFNLAPRIHNLTFCPTAT